MPDEVHAAEAVEFLKKEHDAPFLLTVGFTRPHSPWYAPQEYVDLFPIDEVELTPLLKNQVNNSEYAGDLQQMQSRLGKAPQK